MKPPALNLEGTAARIMAACAAREPQVDPWDPRKDRCAAALSDIAAAMMYEGHHEMTLTAVRSAAAEVRAWRKSLPEGEQGVPFTGVGPTPARVALRLAIRALLDAEMSSGSGRGRCIRYAETYLRVAAEALIAQGGTC